MPASYASKKFGMSTSVINQHAANYPVKKTKKVKAEPVKSESVEKKEEEVEVKDD